jgi:hypothetical protein
VGLTQEADRLRVQQFAEGLDRQADEAERRLMRFGEAQ